MQLVYGKDAVLNIQHTADQKKIKKRNQKLMKENNIREYTKRYKHMYSVGDTIPMTAEQTDPKFGPKYLGPFTIVQVKQNGTVNYCRGAALDAVNVMSVHRYKEQQTPNAWGNMQYVIYA